MSSSSIGIKTDMNALQSWIDLLGASPDQLRQKLVQSRFHHDPDSTYGALTHVALLSNKDGLFYFAEDRLVLIHIHSKPLLAKLNGRLLLSELGTPAANLRSPAGKGYGHYVFSDQGLALSIDAEGRVAFVEIFRPQSYEDYLAHIYDDPGPFVK